MMNRKLLATAVCAGLFATGTAFAQAAQTTPTGTQDQNTTTQSSQSTTTEKKKKENTLGTIIVTGSLLKGVQYQQSVPVQVVPIKADIAAGQFNVTDFVQTTAAAGSASQINGQFGGFVINGGTGVRTVSLRGLGSSRTLVLLDGQRPGPAGTRGQVNAFDLNVIPTSILDRIDVVKDGSSSIYGSDAIAGVVNLITKKRLDHTVLDFYTSVPEHGGGQQYSASIATGWNFKNGNITMAAQVQRQDELTFGDRPFSACQRDLVFNAQGQRIDRIDNSINAGTPLQGCGNLFVDAVIDILGINPTEFGYPHFGEFVPNPNGTTGPLSPVPGYFLGTFTSYANNGVPNPNPPTSNQVNDFPKYGQADLIGQNQNMSFWLAPNFTFNTGLLGPIQWDSQLLLNRRITINNNWRQFFPIVADNNGFSSADPTLQANALNGVSGTLWEPVILFPSNQEIQNDYAYLNTSLSGGFGNSSWSWAVNANATQSDGIYSTVGISNALSGDNFNTSGNTLTGNTLVNYFDPGIINGDKINQLVSAIGQYLRGTTLYKQQDLNAVFNGDLFDLPAGTVEAAVGAEFRHFSIDDKAPPLTWGLSSAGETKGSNTDKEVFGQLGIPILKGLPLIDNLSATVSAREFHYNSVGKNSDVWKYGLNWQVIPTFRIRGTIGTSYRAPALFDLYLAHQTGFVGQFGLDPCIMWAQSNNQYIQKNCAAAGIPGNYNGAGPTAEVISGGNTHLDPETSRAKSLGFVWSPTFANLDIAVDYFDYHIRGEIANFGPTNIVTSCYNKPVYPNAFCDLFTRNPPNAVNNPNNITTVTDNFININQERDRGYDIQANYKQDLPFGTLTADGEATYTTQHVQQIFTTSQASGFGSNNFTGTIGNPRWYGLANISLKRGDWSFNWQGIFVSRTSDRNFVSPTETYLGRPDSFISIHAGAQLRQTVSAGWDDGTFNVIFGVRNMFDRTPPLVSPGDTNVNVVGNIALQATQYDWFGRTWFARMSIKI